MDKLNRLSVTPHPSPFQYAPSLPPISADKEVTEQRRRSLGAIVVRRTCAAWRVFRERPLLFSPSRWRVHTWQQTLLERNGRKEDVFFIIRFGGCVLALPLTMLMILGLAWIWSSVCSSRQIRTNFPSIWSCPRPMKIIAKLPTRDYV